jgi:hypothetical protein
MSKLYPLISEANAIVLPVKGVLGEYRDTLQAVQEAASDDAVRILAGEGSSFREARDRVRKIREAMVPGNLARIQRARAVLHGVWPALQHRPEGSSLGDQVHQLEELIGSETFYEHLGELDTIAGKISDAYRAVYLARHRERFGAFSEEIEAIKGQPGWALLRKRQEEDAADNTAETVLAPLTSRADEHADLPEGETTCRNCLATLSQMESDLAALSGLRAQVLARIIELTTPEPRIERVRLAPFFDGSLQSPEEVKKAVKDLESHLLKLVADGVQIIFE